MTRYFAVLIFFLMAMAAQAQKKGPRFRVIAFYTAKNDPAHISFVHEANKWFAGISRQYHFRYDSTDNWENLNKAFLSAYDVVVFLDTRPDDVAQRKAFRDYMEQGGAWMGFHFSGFALTPSAFPQNWHWYHEQFIAAGEYRGNTWRPRPAVLRVEKKRHAVTRGLPRTFRSAPNEWYSWKSDLRQNPDIHVLLSIDSSSFPLGTGPKAHEIWHGGDYPVVWTNSKFRMLYVNMGHNDMDYENKTNRELSSSFSSPEQNRLLVQGILWLGNKKKRK